MITNSKLYSHYIIPLLFCIMQVAGINAFGQTTIQKANKDSITQREAPTPRARKHREMTRNQTDSLVHKLAQINKDSINTTLADSIMKFELNENKALIDSLEEQNKKKIEEMEAVVIPPKMKDTIPPSPPKPIWVPNPTKATWLAVVFPGGGQIYNRKYWKLPIIYGGFAGCAYALSWNGKMYNDYSQAYLDIMDDDPNTNSFLDLLPNRVTNYSESQLKDLIKRRKDTFRRYRDLSIFAVIGVYLISIIDAYVDAELSNFDITPDLSMRVEPTVFNNNHSTTGGKSVGVQCSFRF